MLTYFFNIANVLIREFRSSHLAEQDSARIHLNENRQLARDRKQLFIHGDFMSEWATKVPHLRSPGNRINREDVGISMGLRLYGAEVIYGDIEGFICYLVPGHLPGGANVTIELTKRIVEDMNERIKQRYSCDAPAKLCCYFDNGSECKNFSLMCYYSLLVEMDIFTTIDLNYLIAG